VERPAPGAARVLYLHAPDGARREIYLRAVATTYPVHSVWRWVAEVRPTTAPDAPVEPWDAISVGDHGTEHAALIDGQEALLAGGWLISGAADCATEPE
jgi:hypothetical protein